MLEELLGYCPSWVIPIVHPLYLGINSIDNNRSIIQHPKQMTNIRSNLQSQSQPNKQKKPKKLKLRKLGTKRIQQLLLHEPQIKQPKYHNHNKIDLQDILDEVP